MSKMSKNYPVMQILGYRRIEEYSNQLVNEPQSLTMYPRSSTGFKMADSGEAKEKGRNQSRMSYNKSVSGLSHN